MWSAGLLPAFRSYVVPPYSVWVLSSRLHGCSNPGSLVALRTKFYALAANIFGIIFAVTLHCKKKMRIRSRALNRKGQITSQTIPELWVPQYDIYFTSPFWHLKFVGDCRFLGSLWTSAIDLCL